jgi:hypothetical protein
MRVALARPQSEHVEPGACESGSAYSITPPEVRDTGCGDDLDEDVGVEEADRTAGPLAVQPATNSRQIASAARITGSNVAAAREITVFWSNDGI